MRIQNPLSIILVAILVWGNGAFWRCLNLNSINFWIESYTVLNVKMKLTNKNEMDHYGINMELVIFQIMNLWNQVIITGIIPTYMVLKRILNMKYPLLTIHQSSHDSLIFAGRNLIFCMEVDLPSLTWNMSPKKV